MIADTRTNPPVGVDDASFEERARRVSVGMLGDLARALTAVRRARGMRQADVAATMGTTQSCVSDFERAKTNPQLRFVARYAAAVGVRLHVTVTDGGAWSLIPGSELEHGEL